MRGNEKDDAKLRNASLKVKLENLSLIQVDCLSRESINSTFNLYTQPRVRVAEADKERKRRGKITRE